MRSRPISISRRRDSPAFWNRELGICGEHGGEPESVKFCHKLGLNYVSCSPKRLPVDRLAAAQASITMTERDK